MSKEQKTSDTMKYAGLATQWMVMMLIAVWAGYKTDKYTQWTVPVFIILFPLVALGISLWQLIRELNKKK